MRAPQRPKPAFINPASLGLWRSVPIERWERAPLGRQIYSKGISSRTDQWMQVGDSIVFVVDDFGDLVEVDRREAPQWR